MLTLQQTEVVDFETFNDVQHVYPPFGRKHDTSGQAMCWCWPLIVILDDGAVIVSHCAEH